MSQSVNFKRWVGSALYLQVAWAVLAAVWNGAGVYLLSEGQRALGPTASVAGAITLLVIAAIFLICVKRAPTLYAVVTAVAGLIALAAVVNAFRQDPALWPSEFWRYAGALLNAGGFVAALAAMRAYFRWRTAD